jgi:hypothetical protein
MKMRRAKERPFLIILALGEFNFEYQNQMMGQVEKVCVPIGHAAVFSSALSHCRGENRTDDYVYHLFAYVVSSDVNYPVGTIERDRDNDTGNKLERSGGEGMVEVLKKANKRKR